MKKQKSLHHLISKHSINLSVEGASTYHQCDLSNLSQHIKQPIAYRLQPIASIRPVGRIVTLIISLSLLTFFFCENMLKAQNENNLESPHLCGGGPSKFLSVSMITSTGDDYAAASTLTAEEEAEEAHFEEHVLNPMNNERAASTASSVKASSIAFVLPHPPHSEKIERDNNNAETYPFILSGDSREEIALEQGDEVIIAQEEENKISIFSKADGKWESVDEAFRDAHADVVFKNAYAQVVLKDLDQDIATSEDFPLEKVKNYFKDACDREEKARAKYVRKAKEDYKKLKEENLDNLDSIWAQRVRTSDYVAMMKIKEVAENPNHIAAHRAADRAEFIAATNREIQCEAADDSKAREINIAESVRAQAAKELLHIKMVASIEQAHEIIKHGDGSWKAKAIEIASTPGYLGRACKVATIATFPVCCSIIGCLDGSIMLIDKNKDAEYLGEYVDFLNNVTGSTYSSRNWILGTGRGGSHFIKNYLPCTLPFLCVGKGIECCCCVDYGYFVDYLDKDDGAKPLNTIARRCFVSGCAATFYGGFGGGICAAICGP